MCEPAFAGATLGSGQFTAQSGLYPSFIFLSGCRWRNPEAALRGLIAASNRPNFDFPGH